MPVWKYSIHVLAKKINFSNLSTENRKYDLKIEIFSPGHGSNILYFHMGNFEIIGNWGIPNKKYGCQT